MILLADSGSTKTDWIAFDGKPDSLTFHTMGFNPFFHSTKFMAETLGTNDELMAIREQVSHIYFFGAGISNNARKGIVKTALKQHFTRAKIEVEHDLLGAAIALCGHEKGIACILGTGSNSCYYDGASVFEPIPSLGYILGDEGSAGAMGKNLLQLYLYNKLPDYLEDYLKSEINLTRESIFESVYHKPGANVFMASVARVLAPFKERDWVVDFISGHFKQFLSVHVQCYEQYRALTTGFIGSIAYFYQDILRDQADQMSVQVGAIIQKPIDALYNHYRQIHFGEK